jgi:hypothetical protein
MVLEHHLPPSGLPNELSALSRPVIAAADDASIPGIPLHQEDGTSE